MMYSFENRADCCAIDEPFYAHFLQYTGTNHPSAQKVIGAYETVFGIGWASGPVIAGVISQFFGNETPYLVFFVIGIGVAILSISKRRMLEPSKNTNL